LTIVGVFAIAHGHAHGVELPRTADALAFTIGFVVATGSLHLTGISIGVLARWQSRRHRHSRVRLRGRCRRLLFRLRVCVGVSRRSARRG
jgi:hydrogenase/urease accessory protein HupE